VDTLDQLKEVVVKVEGGGCESLGQHDCPKMEAGRGHPQFRGKKKGKSRFRSRGGITLEMARPVALTGVERIAVGR